MQSFYILFILAIFVFPATKIYAQTDTTDIFEMSLEDLLNLELESGGKKRQSPTEIPAGIVIISREDIKENGWQTIEEILTNVPGMYTINDYLWFGSDNFGVRGFFTTGAFGNVVVMVNGVTQKEDWYNSFPLTKVNVPVESIDRIEIIRGPMSVVYGGNALLGSVNIITDEKQNIKRISARGGNMGTYKVTAKISGTDKDMSYTINTGAYGNNGIDAAYADMMSDPSTDLPAINLSPDARTKGQLNDDRMYLGASFDYKNFYFESSQSYTKRGVIDFYPGFDDGHLAEIEAANFLLGYEREYENLSTLKGEIGHYSFRNRLDYKHKSDTTGYGFNDIYSAGADINLSYEKNYERSSFILGLYSRYIYRDKLVVDAPNLSEDYINLEAGLSRHNYKLNYALYLHAQYALTPALSVVGGLRIQHSPSYEISYRLRFDPAQNNQNYLYREGTYLFDDVMFIPRLVFMYAFNSKHHLKMMYGRAVKEPSIGENMDVVRFPERPQLEPAFIETLELNYMGLLADYLSINSSIFMNNANNLISRTNTIQDGVMQLFNTNSGRLRTYGFDAGIKYKPSSRFYSKLSFAYQKTTNMQPGYENIEPAYAPEFLGYFNASYTFWKKHTLAISGYYLDEMSAYWSPASSEGPDDIRTPEQLIADGSRLGQPAPAYVLVNINLRFNKLFNTGIFLNFYIHNLSNTEVRYPVTRSNDIFTKGTIGYGRLWSVGLGVEL